MFGYVTPCKMELKVKDYEKFKAYYCGLCHSIKKNYGNLPRLALNYDMTFLAVLLDSISEDKTCMKKFKCAIHPTKTKILIHSNKALDYAAQCNIVLTYYKLIDNINDDKSIKSRLASVFLKGSIKDDKMNEYVQQSLNKLSKLENDASSLSIDEISDAFADLTGYILSNYPDVPDEYKEKLYWFGYNLGKWIYIIDAWDDLEKDLQQGKHNTLNAIYNKKNRSFEILRDEIKETVDYILVACASTCAELLNELIVKKNKDLLDNIVQFGLMEKMDLVFKRSEIKNAEPL